ncbi:polyamine ABC transporter substrate-binding protein [Skermanella stibiiresistens SB22]|uniref:Polyamine ABC transporter substrate-binding protein n=1 Tax=Skermanella stibiiresistens SB22 TaxID=1385369 RepID=W9H5G5_9PROT|nr:polyamine ABC transporter substrate-binding protein [Skermanella stibiiresistens SB22]
MKAQLRRTERRRKLEAAALVAPLLIFLAVFFLAPIVGMLIRSVENSELPTTMPETAAALRQWDGIDLPPEPVFASFARELAAGQRDRTLAGVAKRLTYEVPNMRSVLFATARGLPETPNGTWRDTLTARDKTWGDPATWAVMRRAAAPVTPLYMLASVDREMDASGSIVKVASDRAIYIDIFIRTFWMAAVVTVWCLVLGYPLAFKLASLPPRVSNLLMILVLLPFWTSILVRTGAWVVLLQREGPINEALQWVGLISEPLQLVYNRVGVYVAMIHILLPFMVLPLYSVMRGISPAYMRAATSLGATPFTAFRRVYLPQTIPGVGAGCLLVFILGVGYYITPALVGGAGDQMVSYFVAFFTNQTINWGMAAALGSVLLIATLLLYWVYARLVGIDRMRMG